MARQVTMHGGNHLLHRLRLCHIQIVLFLSCFIVCYGNAELLPTTVTAECNEDCPLTCSDVSHCANSIPDPCGCCMVCIRGINETCGRQYGNCQDGLHCIAMEDGVPRCQEHSWPERCLKAKCPVLFCPEDSVPLSRPPPRNICCPTEAKCQCNFEKCHELVLQCEPGQDRFLLKKGTNQPGDCCDHFECREPRLHCDNVKCGSAQEIHEEYALEDGSCPEDSFRPASYIPKGSCCPIYSACQCRALHCQPAHCPDGEHLIITKEGTGKPGTCCDEFRCAGTSPDGSVLRTNATRCTYEGRVYENGQQWHQDPCQMCICSGGVALCKRMQCPAVARECNWVGIPDEECCPMCLGCKDDNGVRRQIGESWAKDDCTKCILGGLLLQCAAFI
jgi:hypothetical protein